MTIYVLIFVFLVITFFFRKKGSNNFIFKFFLFCFLALLTGFRKALGTDYNNYYNNYVNQLSKMSLDKFLKDGFSFEVLYSFIGVVISNLGFDKPYLFFIVISLITFITLDKAIKNFKFKFQSEAWLVYYSFFFLNFHFNTVRHGIMVSFVWLAFSYASKNDLKKYIINIVIGSMFHISALVFLPFYYFLNIKLKKKHFILLVSVSILAFFLPVLISIIDVLIRYLPNGTIKNGLHLYAYGYYSEGQSSKQLSLGTIIYTFLLFILYKKKDKLTESEYGFNILFNSLFYSLFIAYSFSAIGVIVERLSGVLNLCLLFLIPIIINKFTDFKKTRLFFYILFVLYCSLILSTNIFKKDRAKKYQFYPYEIIL